MELVCPAGSLPALKRAVDQGADSVYLGFRDATNARNFKGLNFDEKSLKEGIAYAHAKGKKVSLALNTYPKTDNWNTWKEAIDKAASLGVNALIIADPSLMAYASKTYPSLRLHLSVQGSATNYEAINFYHEYFNISRVILPRVLSVSQVEDVIQKTPVEIEVFGFGSLCVMVEGRCAFSSFITAEGPNNSGVCSPAKAVRWEKGSLGLDVKLNDVLLERYQENENANYPTVCKGRYKVNDTCYYAIEEPASLNTLSLLPTLQKIGVAAIKLEGRQRSPAYVEKITKVWREALDACQSDSFEVLPRWTSELESVSEGQQHTLGAYHRSWK